MRSTSQYYASWDRYEVDKALQEIDEEERVDYNTKEQTAFIRQQASETLQVQSELQQITEALKSQALVDSLKGSIGPSRRRQRKTGDLVGKEAGVAVAASIQSIPGDNVESFADRDNIACFERVNDIMKSVWMTMNSIQMRVNAKDVSAMDRKLMYRSCVNALKELNSLQLYTVHLQNIANSGSSSNSPQVQASTIEGLLTSGISLRNQVLGSMALLTLQLQRFSACAELCRILLLNNSASKRGSKGSTCEYSPRGFASIWLMRAIAFVGIGSPYLAVVHAKQAQSLYPKYPGIDAVIVYLQALELQVANLWHSKDERGFLFEFYTALRDTGACVQVMSDGRLANQTNSERRKLGARYDGPSGLIAEVTIEMFSDIAKQFVWQLNWEEFAATHFGCTIDTAENSGPATGILYMNDDESVERPNSTIQQLQGPSTDSIANSLVESVAMSMEFILKLLRRTMDLFYDGQVLFLESLFASSKNKFLASAALASTVVNILNKVSERQDDNSVLILNSKLQEFKIGEYSTNLLICCLCNASCCLSNFISNFEAAVQLVDIMLDRSNAELSFSLGTLSKLTPVQLLKLSLQLVDRAQYKVGHCVHVNRISILLRLAHAFEQGGRYQEAMEVLTSISSHVDIIDQLIRENYAVTSSETPFPSALIPWFDRPRFCSFSGKWELTVSVGDSADASKLGSILQPNLAQQAKSLLLQANLLEGPIQLFKLEKKEIDATTTNHSPGISLYQFMDSVRSMVTQREQHLQYLLSRFS